MVHKDSIVKLNYLYRNCCLFISFFKYGYKRIRFSLDCVTLSGFKTSIYLVSARILSSLRDLTIEIYRRKNPEGMTVY